jgi:hypothetical protein
MPATMCDQCHQPLFIAPSAHVCEPRPRQPKTHHCRGGDCRLHAASAELIDRLRRRISDHYALIQGDREPYLQCVCYSCMADRALIDQLTSKRKD